MNRQLSDYISQSRKAGKTDDQIRQELLITGWNPAQVDDSLREVSDKSKLYKKLIRIFIIAVIIIFSIVVGYAALGKYLPQYAKYVQPYLGPVLDRVVGINLGNEANRDIDTVVVKTEPPKFGENLVEICHHASSNLANWHNISVASPSTELNGHLTHGDTVGKCSLLTTPITTPTPNIPHPGFGKIVSCNKNPIISNVDDRKIEDVKCLRDAIIQYYIDHDNYPVSFELDRSLGPYFPEGVPKDPVSGGNYGYAYRSINKSPLKSFQVWAELEKYHPALEGDSDFKSFLSSEGWLGYIVGATYDDYPAEEGYGVESCLRRNPTGAKYENYLAAPDCVYDLKVNGYIPASSNPICAVYFGAGDPIVYIKGPWTDDRQFTNSKDKCQEYMEEKVLGQEHCGQSYPLQFRILLLPGAKSHTYVMPPYGAAEYVYGGLCPNPNNI